MGSPHPAVLRLLILGSGMFPRCVLGNIYAGALNYCCGNCSLMQSRTIVPHVLSLQPQKSFYKEREWEGKGGTALE